MDDKINLFSYIAGLRVTSCAMEDDCKAEAEYWQNVLFSALSSAAGQDCRLHTVTGRMRRRSSQVFALAPFTLPGSRERLLKLWQRVALTL